jgi:hypothetical protein
MSTVAHLVTALLFGGMILFSFGFAAFVFTAFPPHVARTTIRLAFPHFYLFVASTAAGAAALLYPSDFFGAILLVTIAATTVPTRQILMPAINRATDAGETSRFKMLHSLSVIITLCHIAVTAYVLVRIGTGVL